jgi:hypothetical protein
MGFSDIPEPPLPEPPPLPQAPQNLNYRLIGSRQDG